MRLRWWTDTGGVRVPSAILALTLACGVIGGVPAAAETAPQPGGDGARAAVENGTAPAAPDVTASQPSAEADRRPTSQDAGTASGDSHEAEQAPAAEAVPAVKPPKVKAKSKAKSRTAAGVRAISGDWGWGTVSPVEEVPPGYTATRGVSWACQTGPCTADAGTSFTFTATNGATFTAPAVGTTSDFTVNGGPTVGTCEMVSTTLARCTATSSFSINTGETMGLGTMPQFGMSVPASAPRNGAVVFEARVADPSSTDPNPNNNAYIFALPKNADFEIVKAGPDSVQIGKPVTYTLTVTNKGPTDPATATVTDNVPTGITGVTWTCTGVGGATCATPSGSSNAVSTAVTIPMAGSVTITINGTAAASAVDTTVNNTATVAAATGTTDPVAGNNSSTKATRVEPTTDYGDAPNSYKTTLASGGPSAKPSDELRLGAEFSTESDTRGATDATQDTFEDAMDVAPGAKPGEPFVTELQLANTTGADATLAGWFDFNNNGVFDAGERQMVTVPDGATTATLTWPASATAGLAIGSKTYVRYRLYAGAVADPLPAGAFDGLGEVEDYPVYVTDACGYTPVALGNGNFEYPAYGDGTVSYTRAAATPNYGWATTSPDGLVETWAGGGPPPPNGPVYAAPGNGRQFVELNGHYASALFQTLPTTPGTPMTWSLWHRGRGTTDTMELSIGGTLIRSISTGTSWTQYTGTYVVPDGQYSTRFEFKSPSGSTVGNFLDNITFQPAGCIRPTKSVAVTGAHDPARKGDELTYTIAALNPGSSATTNTRVIDVIPPNTTFVPGSITLNGAAVADGTGFTGTGINVPVGSVASKGTATVTFKVKVNADVPPDFLIKNLAKASWTPLPGQPAQESETKETTVRVGSANLRESKTVDNDNPRYGTEITFTVTVTNDGADMAPGVIVTDKLPTGLTYVRDDSASTSTTYDPATGLWSVGDLAMGVSKVLLLTAKVETVDPVQNVIPKTESGLPDPEPCPPDCGPEPPLIDPIASDLVETKTVDNKTPAFGENITYTVTVKNNGPDDTTGVNLTDKLPAGVTYMSDDSGGKYDPATGLWSVGDLANGEMATINIVGRIDTTEAVKNVIPKSGSDNPDPTPCPDQCPPEVPIDGVRKLTFKKTPLDTTPLPGDKVRYEVLVTNDGTLDYPDATFTDNLSGVLDDASWDGDQTDNGAGGTFTQLPDATTPKLVWKHAMFPVGAVAKITYTVTVGLPPMGDKKLTNKVLDGPGSNCQEGSTDPDCGQDPDKPGVGIPVLEYEKSKNTAVPKPGDTVEYTVLVRNTGTAPYPNAPFTDDLTGVLDDAVWLGTQTADMGTVSYAEPKLSWVHPSLPAGVTATIKYSVKVDNPLTRGDKILKNRIEGPAGTNCPVPMPAARRKNVIDPKCTGGPDAGLPDVKVRKVFTPEEPRGGDIVNYTVTLHNKGAGTYVNMPFNDDLSDVIDDATFMDDQKASKGAVPVYHAVKGAERLTWSGDVLKDETVTITYSVKINAPSSGNKALKNKVDVPGTNCDKGSADPLCGKPDPTPIRSVNIKKSYLPKRPMPGDTVRYTVTLTNDGGRDYAGFSFVDDLRDAVDDGKYNNDHKASSGPAPVYDGTRRREKLTWTGDLPLGSPTVVITYSITLGQPSRGNSILKNRVEAPGSNCTAGSLDPDCGDGDGGSSDNGEGLSGYRLPGLRIKKTLNNKRPRPGEKFTYTVTVSNPGKAKFRGAKFTDDFRGVLDDATYNKDAKATKGKTSYKRPVLTWKGDVPAGKTIKIRYSFTVKKKRSGDGALKNKIVAANSNCFKGGFDAACGGGRNAGKVKGGEKGTLPPRQKKAHKRNH